MAKAKKMKVQKPKTILNNYEATNQKKAGPSALKSTAKVANDGKGPLKGIATARYGRTKPSSSSGTLGVAQPLKTNAGGKELRNSDSPLITIHRSSKPKK